MKVALQTRVPEEIYAAVGELARREMVTASTVVRQALSSWLIDKGMIDATQARRGTQTSYIRARRDARGRFTGKQRARGAA